MLKNKKKIIVNVLIILLVFLSIFSLNIHAINVDITKAVASNVDIPIATAGDIYIGSGYIYYNDVCYAKANSNKQKALSFFECLKEVHEVFPDSRMIFLPIPMSQLIIENEKNLNNKLSSQSEIVREFNEICEDKTITVANACDRMYEHRDEYLFFKYDGHWTSRGAYYAYQEFCKVLNYKCDPLSMYREVLLNQYYKGAAYKATNDSRLEKKRDKIYAYIASVSNLMKVIDNKGRVIKEGACIDESKYTYSSIFISGDNPFTIIEANNNKNKTALVIKDSAGCGFVPYLISNYSNIYVVDPRFAEYKLKDKIDNYGKIDDIIVAVAIFTPSKASYVDGLKTMLD